MSERRRETTEFTAGNSEAFTIENGLSSLAREARFRPARRWGRPSWERAVEVLGGIGSASGLFRCLPPTRVSSQTSPCVEEEEEGL